MGRKIRTAAELLKESAQIKKDLASGKIKGKAKIQKATTRMYALNYYAKKKETKALKSIGASKKVKQAKLKARKVDPNQMVLPGFLGQMDTVKIQELFQERLAKAIDARISIEVDEVLSKVLPLKKAQ